MIQYSSTMEKKHFIAALAALAAALAPAADWVNLTPERRIGGRMVSAGYLKGKVVVFAGMDFGKKENTDDIKDLQQVWAGYKSKPFVVVGGHTGSKDDPKAKAMMEKLGVTFPVYAGAGTETTAGFSGEGIRVYDTVGRRVYSGNDIHKAGGVAASAIFGTRRPSGPKAWRTFLDFEIENLPGQAYLRLRDLRSKKDELAALKKKFPDDAARYERAYAKFDADSEVKKLAKLVELSRLVRDRDSSTSAAKRLTKAKIDSEIEKYLPLKDSANPNIVQEAKNAIADLKFAAASFDK